MIHTAYTLHALADAWLDLPGTRLADAYSQNRDELSLAFEGGDEAWTVQVVAWPHRPLLFRYAGQNRARRNTASLFEAARGARVTAVRAAHRDRVLCFELEGGRRLHLALFGPRPNVWLVSPEGAIEEAFQDDASWRGRPAPEPRAAPEVETLEAFASRWKPRRTLAQTVAAAAPLFDATLAEEAIARAGLEGVEPDAVGEAEQARVFEAVRAIEADIAAPRPHVYWRGALADSFFLFARTDPGDLRPEPFEAVDEAVRVFARRQLAQARFDALYRPAERALASAAARLARRAEGMMEALAEPSRADRYERWGHLLSAHGAGRPAGQDTLDVPDLFGDGRPVTVPLDEALTPMENAQRYYDKARRTRAARAHAETRWEDVQRDAEASAALLAALRAVDTLPDLRAFLDENQEALDRLGGASRDDEEALPYRRFALAGQWEAWVGKHARGNHALTFGRARPHDLWLHARGVPGAHVLLRHPNKGAQPDRRTLEAAAALAAFYSDARTHALAAVQVTQRKHVRALKGAALGAVRVDREEVVLVEPGVPGRSPA